MLAVSSILSACTAVEREEALGAKPASSATVDTAAASPSPQQSAGDPAANATVSKTVRLPIPVPAVSDASSAQMSAMAKMAMAPVVPFTPDQNQPTAPAPNLAASNSPAAAKTGRVSSTPAQDGVTGTEFAVLRPALPTPRPVISASSNPASGSTVLAYAGQSHSLAALSLMEFPPAPGEPMPATANNAPADISRLVRRYAGKYGVPESLVHRVIHRESKYNPKAYNKGGFWGLMQISYPTAKSMGYEGPPKGLLDAETNLRYAIKYLRGAWLVADNKNDNAIQLYARGYYQDAKRRDMLHVLQK